MARERVELRGLFGRDLMDVIDAVSMSRGIPRTEMVAEILHAWAVERVHEANMIQDVTRGNPPLAEPRRHVPEGSG